MTPGVEKIAERPTSTMAVEIAVQAMPIDAANNHGPATQAVTSMAKRRTDEAKVS
jgi:hypothetical protein